MVNVEDITNDDELEAKILSLPGYEINKRLTLFVNAILVFQGNGKEIEQWYKKINDPIAALTLWNPDNNTLLNMANIEMQRRFSNYLMSAFAVRDHWFAIRDEYYAGTKALVEINYLSAETFENNELSQFMQDLRNYVTHKGYPSVSKELSFGSGTIANDIYFDKSQLLKFKSWKSLSKKYLEKMGDRAKLIDLVTAYSELINNYYSELMKILLLFHKEDMDELKAYKSRYGFRLDIVTIKE